MEEMLDKNYQPRERICLWQLLKQLRKRVFHDSGKIVSCTSDNFETKKLHRVFCKSADLTVKKSINI